jgi:hypothetical protein
LNGEIIEMGRKRKMDNSAQGNLFKEAGQPVVKQASEPKVTSGPVLYGGLTIDQMVGWFAEVAERYNANHETDTWNGVDRIEIWSEDLDAILSLVEEVTYYTGEREVRMSIEASMNVPLKDGVKHHIVLKVKGRLKSEL